MYREQLQKHEATIREVARGKNPGHFETVAGAIGLLHLTLVRLHAS
jgi:hypothetical protein